MRVIEELIKHFWERGSISRDEAAYLLQHGFVREQDLKGWTRNEPADQSDPGEFQGLTDRAEQKKALEAEALEDELAGRRLGKKRSGKTKVKPTGHDLAPLTAALRDYYFAPRPQYPALLQWGQRLGPCEAWVDAAGTIADASEEDLEAALTAQLHSRPRSLGELWYWFNIDFPFYWAKHASGGGPVAEGLLKILRAATLHEVGRAAQLMKAGEVRDLTVLLSARRRFLGLLPRLYDGHFAKLGKWLVPPAGTAASCWDSLPWAFVLVYNARNGTVDQPPPGYQGSWSSLSQSAMELAFATAYRIDPLKVRDLLLTRLRERPDPMPHEEDWARNMVFDRPLFCPLNWRV